MRIWRRNFGSGEDDGGIADPPTTFLRLTKAEDRVLLTGGRFVSTLTWFRGSHPEAAEHFQQRLRAVVRANPWLTGQIVWRRGHNYLAYKTLKEADLLAAADALFFHMTPKESPLSRDIPLEKLSHICRTHDLTLKPRYHQPLYRVSVVPCCHSPETHFALVVSMSHIAGDGHTFYKLYQALLLPPSSASSKEEEMVEVALHTDDGAVDDASVPTMSAERPPNFYADLVSAMHGRREPLLGLSLSFMIPSAVALIWGKLRGLWSADHRLQQRYFFIDRETIDRMKKEALALASSSSSCDTAILSLNDVVTSWYLTHSRCRHGFMALNVRGRLAGYTDALAGNYFIGLYYQIPRHCGTPQLIRGSLARLQRVELGTIEKNRPVRPPPPLLLGGAAVITNWASMHAAPDTVTDVVLSNGRKIAEEELHCPLYTHQVDTQPSNVVFAFLFRACGTKQLGLFICGSPSKVNGLRDCPFAKPMSLACDSVVP